MFVVTFLFPSAGIGGIESEGGRGEGGEGGVVR